MPPLTASQSTTCDCRAAARRLAQDCNQNESETSIPPGAGSPSDSPPSQQSSSSSSPGAALLQARSLTTHWTHLSTTCSNAALHLTSPSVLRDLITALERVTKKYETHLWKMVFAKTTGPGTGTNPNLVPTLYPGLAVRGSSSVQPEVTTTGHIGVYQLEEDETQILVQEALRTSIEELGGVLSEIQRRVGMIRVESMSMGMYASVGGDHVGQLLVSMGQMRGDSSRLYDNSGDGARLDGEIQMGKDGKFDREMGDGTESDQQEIATQVTLPTDEEMSEINMRLYGCLRRLDFLETGEVRKYDSKVVGYFREYRYIY